MNVESNLVSYMSLRRAEAHWGPCRAHGLRPTVESSHPFVGWCEHPHRVGERNDIALLSHPGVPFNRLHEEGFVSIGCQPCTRPILPTQHERLGRWWWEDASKKECGLHAKADKIG